MLVSVESKYPKKAKECFVVFAGLSAKDKLKSFCSCDETKALITKYFKKGDFKAEHGETLMLRGANVDGFDNVLLVGMGLNKKVNLESLRVATAKAYRALRAEKQKHVGLCLDSLSGYKFKNQELGYVITESVELTNYKYTEYLSEPNHHQVNVSLTAAKASDRNQIAKGIEEGMATSSGINFARRVSDAPSNIMNPEKLAKETQKAAKGTKLKVTVWDKARIKKEKMGSLLGVAAGSAADPRVIIMEYNGAGKSKKPIAFVGKGLTFDTGGISIKPSAGMEAMKYDMCGGANVIGTMLAIAKLGLKVNITAYVGAVENMPDGAAIKPGDILTARNGKTIEVTNTDAEGRLVMADLLVYASEKKPASIFSIATLTGAIIVALGHLHTGLFTEDDKLNDKIQKAAETAGEDLWRMPLLDAHKKQMISHYADICNMGTPSRAAGSAQAAGFLSEFVGNEVPYAHFDIASQMSDMGSIYPYCPDRGACGAMIRTFIEFSKKA
jgi:leucyl aminopeptidase